MNEMKIENVDKVLDEINDQNDQMQQIQDAMAQPIGAAADLDEDDLLSELQVGYEWGRQRCVSLFMLPCELGNVTHYSCILRDMPFPAGAGGGRAGQ